MAIHMIKSGGPNVIVSMIGGDRSWLEPFSLTPRKFTVVHDDGSRTVFKGTGISLQWGYEWLATGQITSLRHYDQSGRLIDRITDFDISTNQIHYAIHHGFWLYGALEGDDIIISSKASEVIDDIISAGLGDDLVRAGAGNDDVDGSFGNDTLYGQAGDDILRGDTDRHESTVWFNGNDTLYGGGGDDMLYGCLGDDILNGGRGSDTAIYDEAFADITVEKTTEGFRVIGASGTDRLINVEHIQAADGTYSWNPEQQAWLLGLPG